MIGVKTNNRLLNFNADVSLIWNREEQIEKPNFDVKIILIFNVKSIRYQ